MVVEIIFHAQPKCVSSSRLENRLCWTCSTVIKEGSGWFSKHCMNVLECFVWPKYSWLGISKFFWNGIKGTRQDNIFDTLNFINWEIQVRFDLIYITISYWFPGILSLNGNVKPIKDTHTAFFGLIWLLPNQTFCILIKKLSQATQSYENHHRPLGNQFEGITSHFSSLFSFKCIICWKKSFF